MTIRRPGQLEWTKKFLEFIVDICHVNAHLTWKRSPSNQRRDHRERAFFLQELVNGLLEVQGEAHIPGRRPTRGHYGWRGFQPKVYIYRQPLHEVLYARRHGLPTLARRTTTVFDSPHLNGSARSTLALSPEGTFGRAGST